MQAIQTGQKRKDSASPLDSQEIGTWQNPAVGSWGLSASRTRAVNDIVVDTQDREAWPSIGDQTESASDANDIDNASVKSGSVISSSSAPGQGQGENLSQRTTSAMQQPTPAPQTSQSQPAQQQQQQPGTASTAGAQVNTSQAVSSVWGSSFVASPGEQQEKIDSTGTWGAPSGGASVGAGVWGSTPPIRSTAGNNQATNMQANQSTSGRDSSSNPMTSSSVTAPATSSSTNSSQSLLGWGSSTTAPQMSLQGQPRQQGQQQQGQQQQQQQQAIAGGAGSGNASSGAQGGSSGSNTDSLSRGAAQGDTTTSSSSYSNSMWQGIASGLSDAAWGAGISSSNSVMASSISISTAPTSGSITSLAKPGEASSTDQWGRGVGGGASGWGGNHPDPPKPDNEGGGWGSPEPINNPGTEGWNQSDAKSTQSWGAQPPPAENRATPGWGQPGTDTKSNSNPSGWGAQPDKSAGSRAWGEPESKVNPNAAGSWGAATDGRSSAPGWGVPGDDKPGASQSQWGAANPTQQPSSQWGSNTSGNPAQNSAQGAWGGSASQPRPIGSQPQNTPSTWAQAAGRGLPPKPEMPPVEVRRDPRQEYIAEAISSTEGWGKTPVRQDTSWDMSESPKTPRKNLSGGGGPGMGGGIGGGGSSSSSSTSSGGDDNHWHQPNDGTAIWESAKENSGPSSWDGGRGGPGGGDGGRGGPGGGGPGGGGGGSSNQWQRDNDSGQWNGPSGQSPADNVWNGPPKDNQWNARRNSESSRGSWGDGSSDRSGSTGPWNSGRDKPNTWNAGDKPERWGSGGGESSQWGGPQGSKPSSEWNNPDNSWQRDGRKEWEQKNSSNEWSGPKKDDNVWDRNGTNVWGEAGKTETGTWNQGRPNPPSRSSSSGSWDESHNIEPSGWGTDHHRSDGSGNDVDNGTSYWGDPSSQNRAPPKNWNNRPMGPPPGPMGPQHDGPGNWNQQANQGNKGGWGDPSGQPGKMDEWGPGRQQPKPGGWGDNQMVGQWQGAKPKTSTGGWGDAPDWGNTNKVPFNAGVMMKHPQMRSQLLQQLMDMGFKKEDAQNALISNNMNIDHAIADLVATATGGRRPDMDMDGPKGRQVRGIGGEDLPVGPGPRPDGGPMGVPPNLQNTPFSNAQQNPPMSSQMLANQLGKPGAPTPNLQAPMSTIGGASVQQRLLQQQQLAAAAKQVPQSPQLLAAQGQAIRGQPPAAPSMQQQLIQQQIVQQLQMAVQAGLISPQLLNQQLTPSMLVMLQQLLQLQQVLQRLVQQQQVIQQNRGLNPSQQRQQLEQVQVTIQKIRQQIMQQQQQINQAQQALAKQQAPSTANPAAVVAAAAAAGNPVPPTSVSTAADPNKELLKELPTEMSNLQMKESAPRTSRLGQWKLPSPDRDNELSVEEPHLNKAPGSKPLSSSHSSPNLQPKPDSVNTSLPFSDSTWSAGANESSTSWPGTSATSTSTTTGSTESDARSIHSNESKESLEATPDDSDDAKAGLEIVEFVPGKQWRGTMSKNVEDDPFLTPGDVNRSLSISTVKEEYITNTLGGKSGSSPTAGLEGSQWSSVGNLATKGSTSTPSTKSSWSSPSAETPPSLTSDLWGSTAPNKTRPPPGLTSKGGAWQQQQGSFHRSVSWAPGDRSSMAAQGGWGSSVQVSTWLILKNLNPQVDINTLRTLCMQHGPLQGFHVFQNLGQGIVCYRNKEEAAKAQKALNTCSLGSTTIVAEFCVESDVQRLLDQGQSGQQQPQSAITTSVSSLWPNPSVSIATSQGLTQRSMSTSASTSSPGSQWNGASSVTSGSMWSSGGGSSSNSLWAHGLDEAPQNPLLPGDLLGGQ